MLGKAVILAWHVDYWDRLGWPDPFADRAYTNRQKEYVRALNARGLVTPQILVANRPYAKDWAETVAKDAAKPATVTIAAEIAAADGEWTATIRLSGTAPDGTVVLPVLYQRQASTDVPRGENAGKTLVERFVVRRLLDPVPFATATAKKGATVTLALPPGVDPGNLGLAVLVEDPAAMRTIEAATFALPEGAAPAPAAAAAPAPAPAPAVPAELGRQITARFAAGEYEAAAELCRQLAGLLSDDPSPRYNLACALSRLGKKEEALAALGEAVALGFDDPDHMGSDADLAAISAEKEFATLVAGARKNRLEAEEKLYEPPAGIEGVLTKEGRPEDGLRWRLRLPADATAKKPARLIVWLHPSGGSMNRQVEALSPRFAEKGFALLVLTQKQWVGWTQADATRLLDGTLPDVGALPEVDPRRPILLGFSAGGQMAIEMWMKDPGRYGGLLLDAAYPIDMEAYRAGRIAGRAPPAPRTEAAGSGRWSRSRGAQRGSRSRSTSSPTGVTSG